MPSKIQSFTYENGIDFAVSYENAQLFEFNSGWRIRYKAINPIILRLEYVEMKIQRERRRINNDDKARKYAKIVCDNLNRKLEKGWSPWNILSADKKL